MTILKSIASILIILGSLNWGLYGLFGLDLIDRYFGGRDKLVGRILYILVGLAGLFSLLYVIIA